MEHIPDFLGGTATAPFFSNPGPISRDQVHILKHGIFLPKNTYLLRKYFWNVDLSKSGNEFWVEVDKAEEPQPHYEGLWVPKESKTSDNLNRKEVKRFSGKRAFHGSYPSLDNQQIMVKGLPLEIYQKYLKHTEEEEIYTQMNTNKNVSYKNVKMLNQNVKSIPKSSSTKLVTRSTPYI